MQAACRAFGRLEARVALGGVAARVALTEVPRDPSCHPFRHCRSPQAPGGETSGGQGLPFRERTGRSRARHAVQ